MNPVNWFEIPVENLERATHFYQHALDVELEIHDFGELTMAWFPMTQEAPGAAGALVKQASYVPSHQGTMVYFSVLDIDATLRRIASGGGKVLKGKSGIGEFGFVAHFEDSEGNRVALHARS